MKNTNKNNKNIKILLYSLILVFAATLAKTGLSNVNPLDYKEFSCRIPDTGQTKCYDDVNEISCPNPGNPFYGQDANYNINTQSFTKLDSQGNDLPDSASEWTMVRDNVTELIWEVKTDDGFIHDKDNTFTWYDSNPQTNGGDFIKTLNDSNYGEFSDWRLPTLKELLTIVDYGKKDPTINTSYFPKTKSVTYCSSNTDSTGFAQGISFYVGNNTVFEKSSPSYIRAVRGGKYRSLGNYNLNNDGTVTDPGTGLMWQREPTTTSMSWERSMEYCENLSLSGFTDWRLPTIKELVSIVDFSNNKDLFYGKLSMIWSSTPDPTYTPNHPRPTHAWFFHSSYARLFTDFKSFSNYAIAVRGGQCQLSDHLFIRSPKQASQWQPADKMLIKWHTQNISGDVSISISREGGKADTYIPIVSNAPNNGEYTWTVTQPLSVNCMLKIEPLHEPEKSTSQGLFSILNTPSSVKNITLSYCSNSSISEIDPPNSTVAYITSSSSSLELIDDPQFTLEFLYSNNWILKTSSTYNLNYDATPANYYHYTITVVGKTAAESFALTISDDKPKKKFEIGVISDQTTTVNTPIYTLPLTLTNNETNVCDLSLSLESSMVTLVSPENISYTCFSDLLYISLTPTTGQSGVATITITATDAGKDSLSTSFDMTIIDDRIFKIGVVSDQTTNINTPIHSLQLIATNNKTPVCDLDISFESSMMTLVLPENISYTCFSDSFYISLTPTSDKSGIISITITVIDAEIKSLSTSFDVSIYSIDDKPLEYYEFSSRIPDTGQAKCYENSTEILCPIPGELFFGQDANYKINPQSFTKLDSQGKDLPASALKWRMVRDNITGLIWEVKTDDGSIHNKDNTYTWYDNNSETNGGNSGKNGDGTDTEAYIKALNAIKYGGYSDWRLPTMIELVNLINYGTEAPYINTFFFPETMSSKYWTSMANINSTNSAWIVNFNYGNSDRALKSSSQYIRAVRGEKYQSFNKPTSYVINNETVTDMNSGLMWQRKTEENRKNWQSAMEYSENLSISNFNDWRLPTIKELTTIIDLSITYPTLYKEIFDDNQYWSSTSTVHLITHAYCANFNDGFIVAPNKSALHFVRAVRGGQCQSKGHLIIWSPEQASQWNPGNKMQIKWNNQDILGNVTIFISREGGMIDTFVPIAIDTPNDGEFEWSVTQPPSVNCMLKIEPVNAPEKVMTQGLFTILYTPPTNNKILLSHFSEESISEYAAPNTIIGYLASSAGDLTLTDSQFSLERLFFNNWLLKTSPTYNLNFENTTAGNYFYSITVEGETTSESFALTISDDKPKKIFEIASIPDLTINESTTIYALPLTAMNNETPVCELDLSFESSMITMISSKSISYTCMSNTFYISITPSTNQSSAATITITATDKQSLTLSTSFDVTVFSVDDQLLDYDEYTFRIPDTGQIRCYDNEGEILCPNQGELFYGQDATYNINTQSFTKLDYKGNDLPDSADQWSMVRDNITGLIWEVKNSYNYDERYTWYDNNPETNGGNPGEYNSGKNTQDYIISLNNTKYGGFSDWRLPTMKELLSIVDYGKKDPSINILYFPRTMSKNLWSSITDSTDFAKGVNFYTGNDSSYEKSSQSYIRAVRGGQCRSFDNLFINNGETVTDLVTGLMWQKESTGVNMKWQSAMLYCKSLSISGYNDWRLPSLKELLSIADDTKNYPSINKNFFYGNLFEMYWSSTSYSHEYEKAWNVPFEHGGIYQSQKSTSSYVRGVRGGQSKIFDHLFIMSPKQASKWRSGEKMPIIWDTQNINGNVIISISHEGGKADTYIPIASTPNDGAFVWKVPEPLTVLSANCMLKIEPENSPEKGTEAGLFSILKALPSDRNISLFYNTGNSISETTPPDTIVAFFSSNAGSLRLTDSQFTLDKFFSNYWIMRTSSTYNLDYDSNTSHFYPYTITVVGDTATETFALNILDDTCITWLKQDKTASDGQNNDKFAYAVSISGDYAIVGAVDDDNYTYETDYFGNRDEYLCEGSAYIFKRDNNKWVEQTKLFISYENIDSFGSTVSIFGDYAVVGAPSTNINNKKRMGAVFVFKRTDDNSWIKQTKLMNLKARENSYFGKSVSMSKKYLFVGAETGYYSDRNRGIAYIYEREDDNWVEVKRIKTTDTSMWDGFSDSLSITDDYAIVGAPWSYKKHNHTGAAYIFKRIGESWIEQTKLCLLDGEHYDRFGCSVDISNDYAIVGASGYGDTGASYIYKRSDNHWFLQTVLRPDTIIHENFGNSVSIDNDRAIVGSWRKESNESFFTMAYIFKLENKAWTELSKFEISVDKDYREYSYDNFSRFVSNSGNSFIVGECFEIEEGSVSFYTESIECPQLTLSSNSEYVPSDAGFLTITLNISGINSQEIPWKVTTDDSWISIEPASGSGSDVLNISYSANDTPERIATITVFLTNTINHPALLDNPQIISMKQAGLKSIYSQQLIPGDSYYNSFGCSVSISDNYAAVGYKFDNQNGNYSGSVYLYEQDGFRWKDVSCLLPNDGEADNNFGNSVYLSDDSIIIGAYMDNDNGRNSGSAYIFKREGNTWKEQSKLLSSDGETNDQFGCSVAISENYAFVGACNDDVNDDWIGSVYVFIQKDNKWIEHQKLMISEHGKDHFGCAISISNNYAIIGSEGAAYIYFIENDQWKLDTIVYMDNDSFGRSVSISGNYALISHFYDDAKGRNSGSAHIYKRTDNYWSEHTNILPDDLGKMDFFGSSVFISGDYAIIGSPGDNNKGINSGAAYIYKLIEDKWIEQSKLLFHSAKREDNFGVSVSISNDFYIIGATDNSKYDGKQGYAYISQTSPPGHLEISTSDLHVLANQNSKSIQIINNANKMKDIYWTASTDASWVTIIDPSGFNSRELVFTFTTNTSSKRTAIVEIDNGDKYINNIFVTISQAGAAYTTREQQKLLASDAHISGYFGKSVSIKGEHAIVGSNEAAYIYKLDSKKWTETIKLSSHDNQMDFGDCVSISDNYAIVGAKNAVFIFKKEGDNWLQQQKIVKPDESDNFFGESVSISDNHAIVGAWGDDENGYGSGAAYIFKRVDDNWELQIKLLASDGSIQDYFGRSVSISGNHAIVGAPHYSEIEYYRGTGAAYIFYQKQDIWTEQVKLIPTDVANDGEFGNSVSLSEGFAVIGAYRDDANGTNSGSAYIYKYEGDIWIEQSKLLPSDGTYDDEFGTSVCISGNQVVIGTQWDDENGSESGAAYIFEKIGNTWIEQIKILPSDGSGQDNFGGAVSISENYVIVGAQRNNDNGGHSGSSYIFYNPPPILSVFPHSRALLAESNHTTFTILNTGNKERDMNWTATTDASWISMDHTSGNGDAVIQINFSKNDGEYRNATITITSNEAKNFSQIFTIEQAHSNYINSNLNVNQMPNFGNCGMYGKFGHSVSISNDYIIVGAKDLSCAYILKKTATSWRLCEVIRPGNNVPENFGCSVSISGDYAIVGARGAAYLYNKRDEYDWVETYKKVFSDDKYNASSCSVSIFGDYAIIGYVGNDEPGYAYVYKREEGVWFEQSILSPSDSNNHEKFGYSVSISDEYAIIGNITDDTNGISSGAAYIFKREEINWLEHAILLAYDANENGYFGNSVSISGDYAIIGAYRVRNNNMYSGSAYIFRRDKDYWEIQTKLHDNVFGLTTNFGISVSIFGDNAIVGADLDNENGVGAGAVHVYQRKKNNWRKQAKLIAHDGSASDNFGFSVAISDKYFVVGAIFDNIPESYCYHSGSASIFLLPDHPGSIIGDINGDNNFDLTDFIICQQVLVGKKLSQLYLNAVDLNQSGNLDAGDLNILLKLISGQISITSLQD